MPKQTRGCWGNTLQWETRAKLQKPAPCAVCCFEPVKINDPTNSKNSTKCKTQWVYIKPCFKKNQCCVEELKPIFSSLTRCCVGRLQHRETNCFSSNPPACLASATSDMVSMWQTKLCLALSPFTCYRIYLMYFSCEQPLRPTDTLWCSYIPGSHFSIYTHWDEQWAPGSPHSPTCAHVDTHPNTQTHTRMLWVKAEVEVRAFHQHRVWPYELM